MLKKRKQKDEVATIEKKEDKKAREVKESSFVKSRKGFRIYVGFLSVVTIAFLIHLVYSFYIQPRSASGTPIFGSRLDEVVEISENVVTATEQFGLNQSRVESVSVDIIGLIVYIDVRVDEGTGVEVARTAAEDIADFFLDEAGAQAEGYTFQLVVAKGNIDELLDENRADSLDHIRLSQMEWLEELVEFAEKFPTTDEVAGSDLGTITRVLNNLSLLRRRNAYTDTVGEYYAVYEAALADFEARVNALTPLTANELDTLIEQNDGQVLWLDISDIRNISQSDIADFPSWGTINSETGLIEWT